MKRSAIVEILRNATLDLRYPRGESLELLSPGNVLAMEYSQIMKLRGLETFIILLKAYDKTGSSTARQSMAFLR
jgi:hypothetical protein